MSDFASYCAIYSAIMTTVCFIGLSVINDRISRK